MKSSLWIAALFVAVLLSCDAAPPPAPNVFGPKSTRQATTTVATGQLGDDCRLTGASGCQSGLCARLSGTTAICTELCETATCDADAGWRCAATGPESAEFWCVPEVIDGGAE